MKLLTLQTASSCAVMTTACNRQQAGMQWWQLQVIKTSSFQTFDACIFIFHKLFLIKSDTVIEVVSEIWAFGTHFISETTWTGPHTDSVFLKVEIVGTKKDNGQQKTG